MCERVWTPPLTYTLLDAWMDSYPCEPAPVTLDIDDTCDVVHGQQQLSLFNAHYDERCFPADPRL
jgi:Transposase DDE domain group 1